MWFNSTQREEPYQLLTWDVRGPETVFISSAGVHTGAAWLSSARVVRCWVKSRNERNPHLQLPSGEAGHSGETAGDKPEEGGDDVIPHGPYELGYTRATMAVTEGCKGASPSQSRKAVSVRIALCNSRA